MSFAHRITLSYSIPSDAKGLKSFIQQVLTKLKIHAEVERVLGDDGVYSTAVTMEGPESHIRPGKKLLIKTLKSMFPDINVPTNWHASESTSYLSASSRNETSINRTLPALLREHSSGEIQKVETFEELIPNGSVSLLTSSLVSHSLSFVSHMGYLFRQMRKVIIQVSYKSQKTLKKVDMNITPCVSWADFLDRVDQNEVLAIPVHVRKIYTFNSDGTYRYVNGLTDLKKGEKYHVETDFNKPVATMDEFFDRLITDQGLFESDVAHIKSTFKGQNIDFKLLMSLTEEELEKIGISNMRQQSAIVVAVQRHQFHSVGRGFQKFKRFR